MSQNGLINLNKPKGWTSREAVDCIERLLGPGAKVGHAGTLDPLATGVLVLCVGTATRLIEYVQRMPKRYAAGFLLGRTSPTEDVEAEVTELPDPPVPTLPEIEAAARRLVGRIEQRPPAFSALKVGGRRAYDLARRGQDVKLKPRPVEVYALAVRGYDYPRLALEIECGSGTYIRSLGRDLAESLGTGAVMAELTRTAIGSLGIDEAVEPERLDASNWRDFLLPMRRAVESLPAVRLSADELIELRHGRTIPRPPSLPESNEYAAFDPAGRLAAILAPRGRDRLGPIKNFTA
jgi:tRNA pseudouridine55 synthase